MLIVWVKARTSGLTAAARLPPWLPFLLARLRVIFFSLFSPLFSFSLVSQYGQQTSTIVGTNCRSADRLVLGPRPPARISAGCQRATPPFPIRVFSSFFSPPPPPPLAPPVVGKKCEAIKRQKLSRQCRSTADPPPQPSASFPPPLPSQASRRSLQGRSSYASDSRRICDGCRSFSSGWIFPPFPLFSRSHQKSDHISSEQRGHRRGGAATVLDQASTLDHANPFIPFSPCLPPEMLGEALFSSRSELQAQTSSFFRTAVAVFFPPFPLLFRLSRCREQECPAHGP